MDEEDYYPERFTKEEKALLEPTEAFHTLNDLNDLQSDYEMLKSDVFDVHPKRFLPSLFSFDVFVNASTVVASRCFRIDDDVGEALIPLADIFNHEVHEHVYLESDPTNDALENNDIDMRIVREAKEGDEVMNTYGDHHSNAYFLAKYGFVTRDENPNDMVSFDSNIICKDGEQEKLEFWKSRMKIIEEMGEDLVELDDKEGNDTSDRVEEESDTQSDDKERKKVKMTKTLTNRFRFKVMAYRKKNSLRFSTCLRFLKKSLMKLVTVAEN